MGEYVGTCEITMNIWNYLSIYSKCTFQLLGSITIGLLQKHIFKRDFSIFWMLAVVLSFPQLVNKVCVYVYACVSNVVKGRQIG